MTTDFVALLRAARRELRLEYQHDPAEIADMALVMCGAAAPTTGTMWPDEQRALALLEPPAARERLMRLARSMLTLEGVDFSEIERSAGEQLDISRQIYEPENKS